MALTLVSLSGFQRGISADETGINISSLRITVEPEFKEFLPGKTGEVRGFAIAPMKRTAVFEGEISGATGVMAAVAGTAFTPANTVAYFGGTTGGFYLDSAEVTETRDGWKSVSATFTAHAGVT